MTKSVYCIFSTCHHHIRRLTPKSSCSLNWYEWIQFYQMLVYFVSCINKCSRSQTEISRVICGYTEANGYRGQIFCASNCRIIRVTKTHNISLKGLIEKSLLLLLRKNFCWKWVHWTTRGEQNNSVLNFKSVHQGALSNILYTFTIITFLLVICEQIVSGRLKMRPFPPLSCLFNPLDDLFKLLDWGFLYEGLRSYFRRQSIGCGSMQVVRCLISSL